MAPVSRVRGISGLRTLFKLLRNPWIFRLFRRSTFRRFIREQKEIAMMNPDAQMELLMRDFREAIRETDFVRRYFPELLSVEEPEDLIEVKVTPEYPDENYFQPFKKYILRYAYTSGTSLTKPKKVFFPITKKSLEILMRMAATLVAIALLGTDRDHVDRILAIAEPGLITQRFVFIAKFASKKVDIITRGEVDVEKFLRRTKAKYDMIFGELPAGINLLGMFKKFPDRLNKEVTFVTGGGVFTEEYLSIVREVMDVAGVRMRVINMYGSTEGLLGGVGEYIDRENPYYISPPMVKPIYVSSFHLATRLTGDQFEFPEKPEGFLHKISPGEYSIVVTVASAFAVPNYFLGDVAKITNGNVNVMGRNLRRVLGLPVAVETYTSPVIRVSGIVIKQTLSKIIEQVLGTNNFIVVVSPNRNGALMSIYVEEAPEGFDVLKKKLLEFIKRSPEHSYLIRDIKDGVLSISFGRVSGISAFYNSTRERFRIFLAR